MEKDRFNVKLLNLKGALFIFKEWSPNKPRKFFKCIVNFSLQIKQSNYDVAVLNAIKKFFNVRYLKPKYNIRTTTTLWIRDVKKVSKLLDSYPLFSIKWLNYLDWKRLIDLKTKKEHYKEEGLLLMYNIKNNMKAKRFK